MKIRRLNFIGYIQGNSGYSVLSRALINLMAEAGIDVRVTSLRRQPIQEFLHLQQKDPANRFQLLHQIPTVNPMADGFYTVTEFDEPTYGAISPLRRAKWILTESNFCKEVFEEISDAPIDVIHYPIDPQFKPEGVKFQFNPEIEKFGFKFVSVFEWVMRKNPYMLIKAFAEEFDKNEDVCLVLRCWSRFQNPVKWIAELAPDHNVFWIPEDLPHLSSFYRAGDCFVTSTLGEGFGHPIAEAMACGLPVIVPKSTGILDYCDSNNSILVPVEEKQVVDTMSYKLGGNRLDVPHHPFGLIKSWFHCWEPDIEELKKAMRKVFRSKATFVAQNAPKIRDTFSIDNILKEVKEAFEIE